MPIYSLKVFNMANENTEDQPLFAETNAKKDPTREEIMNSIAILVLNYIINKD